MKPVEILVLPCNVGDTVYLVKKYTRLNYQKGILVSSFMDSALRHIFKYLDGWDDEDHLSAAAFNILGAIQMEERNPEMQDVEARNNHENN